MEKLFVLAVAVGFTFLNSLHVISQWLANPPDRVFTGIAHYFADYFLYVDVMAQGAAGYFAAAPHFTNELLPAIPFYWYNTAIGRLGNVFGFSPFASYNVSLLILVLVLCLLWYYLSKLLFPTKRLLRLTAWIFILSASSFFDQGQFWLSPSPAFNRLGGVPHQVLQTILLVSLVIVYSKKQFVFLVGLAFLAATATPIQVLLVLAAAFLVSIRQRAYAPFALLLLGAVPGLLLSYQWFTHPVFAAAKAWEATQLVRVPIRDMILSIGPVVLFVTFGIRSFLTNSMPLGFLFFLYGVGSLVAFYTPVFSLIGSASARWLSPAPHAIFAILGAQGVISLSKKWRVFALALYLFLTIPALYSQINARANPAYNTILTSPLNHVPKSVVDALTFLKNQPDNNRPVVLTDPALAYDVLVPVFTGKISFTGHPIHTLYPQVKENLRRRFFDGEMTAEEAKQFLSDHRIGYAISQKPNLHFATRIFSNEVLAVFSF